MKLKNNVLKIVMIMLVVMALIIPVASYASEVNVISPGEATPSPSVTATPKTTSTSTPKATPTAKTNLPQTGIEDYTGLIVVTILLGASAVFAYIKIKQYKNL